MSEYQSVTYEQVVNFFKRIASDEDLAGWRNATDPEEEERCLYQDGLGNHCIVGHWFHYEMGLSDEWMSRNIEDKTAINAVDVAIRQELIPYVDEPALALLERAQDFADNLIYSSNGEFLRRTWGEVVEALEIVD
jgi:hypothetical protein